MSHFARAPTDIPRTVIYHQTHYHKGAYVSLQPLLDNPSVFITHLIIAAFHINEDPDKPTLNDDHPEDPKFAPLWDETAMLRTMGTKILLMLGGAAKGSYERLSGSDADFEKYYAPLAKTLRSHRFDGIDLDVEEPTTLATMTRLINRLHADFGSSFLITLAPVAPALIDTRANLSGFSYAELEQAHGSKIAFYNTQFYCGWGSLETPMLYMQIIKAGWSPTRIVAGTVTAPETGTGFVPMELLSPVLMQLMEAYPGFGGVMGWEYFNSQPGGADRPWEWAEWMSTILGTGTPARREEAMVEASDRDRAWDALEEQEQETPESK